MWSRLSAVLGVAVGALAPSAHAVSFAEVRASGMSFSFVDLLPSDGVAPSVTITGATTYGRGSVRVSGPGDELDSTVIRRGSTLAPLSAEAPVPSDFAVSALVAFEGGQTGALSGEAYAADISGSSRATGQVFYDFILSPNTSMTVRATLTGTAFSAGVPVSSNGQFGYFGASMSFSSQGGGLDRVFSIFGTASPAPPDYSFVQVGDSKAVEYTFTNATAFPLIGRIDTSVDSWAQNAAVAVVPEPTSQALLLAGLVVVGLAGRRAAQDSRKRSAAPPAP